MKRYRILTNDGWSNPVSRRSMNNSAQRHLSGDPGGFTYQIGTGNISRRFTHSDMLVRINRVARHDLRVHDRVRIRNGNDKLAFMFNRTTNLIYTPAQTPGNARIDAVHGFVFSKFPKAFSLGLCDCRRVLGTSIWSQHAYCNAEDYGAGVLGMSALYAMADAVVAEVQHGTLKGKVAHVIVGDKVWEPSTGWQHYGGEYHYHVHVDGWPNCSGTPACAGGSNYGCR